MARENVATATRQPEEIHSLLAVLGYLMTIPETPERNQAIAEVEWLISVAG